MSSRKWIWVCLEARQERSRTDWRRSEAGNSFDSMSSVNGRDISQCWRELHAVLLLE